jgi:hypothetical protein
MSFLKRIFMRFKHLIVIGDFIWLLGLFGTMDYDTAKGIADAPATMVQVLISVVILAGCALCSWMMEVAEDD